uniref:Amino acid transporter transmembrane domain-containing protein n=1 Tax=Guillardia theta TaxID=55529 RepID=A0A7S4PPD0_GUITH
MSADPMEEQRARSLSHASAQPPILSTSLTSQEARETGEHSSRSNSLMLMRESSGSHMKNIGLKSLEDFDVAQRGLGQYAAETESLLSDHDIMGGSGRSSARISATGEVALSSFGQTVFNALNLLMGVGLLSLPYAMRLAGWFGMVILLIFSLFTCYTAKLLGRLQEYTPKSKLREGPGAYTIYGFHDMGYVVFGNWGKLFISILFIAETFGYCCVYLIIEGENLHHQFANVAVFQDWARQDFMVLSAVLFLPTVLLRNLSWLSYFSALGVFSSIMLLVGVAITGLWESIPPNQKYCSAPCTGSLIRPSPTDDIHLDSLTKVIGLIMVGFAGHAVFPTLRNDMIDKKQYTKMVDVSYVAVTVTYAGMAAVGYVMFGVAAQSEITLNLSNDNWVSRMVVWIVVVNPVTKFALDMAPIALGLEAFFAAYFKIPQGGFHFLLSIVVRTFLVALALTIVIAAPNFAVVLGVMGSLCAFTISVTFPCWCYVKLFWNEISWFERIINVAGTMVGVVCAIIGTVASMMHPGSEA